MIHDHLLRQARITDRPDGGELIDRAFVAAQSTGST